MEVHQFSSMCLQLGELALENNSRARLREEIKVMVKRII